MNKKNILLLLTVIVCLLPVFISSNKKHLNKEIDTSFGTAGKCLGTTLVITMQVDDRIRSWNMSSEGDQGTFAIAHKNLEISTNYLIKEAKRYGHDIDFIYDWEKDSDLLFKVYLDIDCLDEDFTIVDDAFWSYISTEMDSRVAKLADKYDADNVIFVALINTDESTTVTSCTRNWYSDMPYPYEICQMYMRGYENYESPAGFAHEFLHTFGAPDYYYPSELYGISQEFVDNMYASNSNCLMFTCYDMVTESSHFDRITNDISEMTAYYIGWTDDPSAVTDRGLNSTRFN